MIAIVFCGVDIPSSLHPRNSLGDQKMQKNPAGTAREGIELLSRAMPALLEGAGKLDGRPTEAEALLTSVVSGDSGDFFNVLLLAYQTNKPLVGNLLRKLPKGAELADDPNGDISRFTVYEVCLVHIKAGREDGVPISLARSLRAMPQPGVSPKNPAVAWLQSKKKQSPIEVATLDGKEHLTVCAPAKPAFDWSADGRALIFATPVGGKGDSLARIQKTTVIQESGALVESAPDAGTPNGLPASVEMGMAILPDPPRLQALPDGRVLFSSLPATLPAPGSIPDCMFFPRMAGK